VCVDKVLELLLHDSFSLEIADSLIDVLELSSGSQCYSLLECEANSVIHLMRKLSC